MVFPVAKMIPHQSSQTANLSMQNHSLGEGMSAFQMTCEFFATHSNLVSVNPQKQAHQKGFCLLTWKSPCINESLAMGSFLRLLHFPNNVKMFVLCLIRRGRSKATSEARPHGPGRRWVTLWDALQAF